MIKRNLRLSLSKPVKFSRKFKNDQIILEIAQAQNPNPRFAVVVPARFCPQAVGRSRTKRLVWAGLSQLSNKILAADYKIKVCTNLSQFNLGQVYHRLVKLFSLAGSLNG